ncbi:MAG: CsgG/HfaB family protein [Fidelibacterota bacterium]
MHLFRKALCYYLTWALVFLYIPINIEAQNGDKIPVAVLDLEGRGISALEAATLTDRLRSEMVEVGAFVVVERGQMEMILEEQGFQQTGCTSAECAVEVGKLLGVQKMVTGSIGKLGELYTVDARMFDVQTGEIERVSKREYRGGIEGLIDLLEVVTKDLAGIQVVEEKEEVVVEQPVPEEAPKKKGGKKWILWVGVLAVAGGGAAYYLSTQGEEAADLPLPPDPPQNP